VHKDRFFDMTVPKWLCPMGFEPVPEYLWSVPEAALRTCRTTSEWFRVRPDAPVEAAQAVGFWTARSLSRAGMPAPHLNTTRDIMKSGEMVT
jgi:hypothetical protein